MTPFAFNTTPAIVFGAGKLAEIGTIAAARLGARVTIVSDKGLVATGIVARAREFLERAKIACDVIDTVEADPKEATVRAAQARAQAFGATGVIGLGGGSPMDVAKLVALLARSGEPLATIYGVGLAKGPRLPLMLVPTTAGTGSEVTPISIITTGETEKKGVVAPVLLPDIALLDPDLTLGLPPHVTAATGIDAMVHAIEAYTCINPNKNPVSLALARAALRLLGANIRKAVSEGGNVEARGGMLLGSMLAGQAFANSPVGAVHALAYPLGGVFKLPHGLTNALVLPEVMKFNAAKLDTATAYADLAPDVFPDLVVTPSALRAKAFIERLHALAVELGLPKRLRDVPIPNEALPRLAEDAMRQTRLLVNNPRPLVLADALAIYQAAW